jgi:hypothetical protein
MEKNAVGEYMFITLSMSLMASYTEGDELEDGALGAKLEAL